MQFELLGGGLLASPGFLDSLMLGLFLVKEVIDELQEVLDDLVLLCLLLRMASPEVCGFDLLELPLLLLLHLAQEVTLNLLQDSVE